MTATVPENTPSQSTASSTRKRWHRDLTTQVLVAILLGILFGHLFPEQGIAMKPLADGFVKMIKMIVGPVIFLTIVTGISAMGDIKKVGKLGAKTLIYFEVVTTIALILGMAVMHIFQPGVGMDTSGADSSLLGSITESAHGMQEHSTVGFLLGIIPDSMVGAFSSGNLLQILFVAILFGVSMSALGDKTQPIEEFFDRVSHIIFHIIGIIMKLAPLAAFGAMAFTIGQFGLKSLLPLGYLILLAIGTMLFFITVVLGSVARYYRFPLWQLIGYVKDELFIILGTSSSETVLPRLIEKMTHLGCAKSVVGMVVPTGYSFNLDGSSIYLSMATLFIAQAYGVDLSFEQELTILGILLLTSKGAAGVTGSAFVVLAATISAMGGVLPLEGVALLLGIDRFMSSIRALTNFIGNAVATVAISRMEGALDDTIMQKALRHEIPLTEEEEYEQSHPKAH